MTAWRETLETSATWSEILAQPDNWRDWAKAYDPMADRAWAAAQDVDEVWFCGAGTSAYIGDILAAGLPQDSDARWRFRSVPSTDLVARPQHYLPARPLVVNFGRSGDSSESLGTLEALRALAPDAPVLNITCNPDGALARQGTAIVLPEACHDAGFAMTSSFTTMLLTALGVFDPEVDFADTLVRLADAADGILSGAIGTEAPPPRAVYVGSGPMAYAARECALKVMELSAGQIPALWDSALGFRHGPKSFVQDGTAIHVLMGREAKAYDRDLLAELRLQFPDAKVRAVGPGPTGRDVWDVVLAVLPAQVQAAEYSARLGLNIDDPFVGQSTLTRVVSGVRLHPVAP